MANQLLRPKTGALITTGIAMADKFRIILGQELGLSIINNVSMPMGNP